MIKPKIVNIVFYFFIKYSIFYIFMMFKNNDFTLIQINFLKNATDWFFYLWTFLFLPVVCSFLFSIPIYFIFKIKGSNYFILLMSIILIFEYSLYTYLASQADLKNGVYNAFLSIILLSIFFKTRLQS